MDTTGLAATVVSTAERFGARNAPPHVVYLLRPDLGPHERWYVERRFSAFRRLRKDLAHSHAELMRGAPPLLRGFPQLSSRARRQLLEHRTATLQTFVNNLLMACAPLGTLPAELSDFLALTSRDVEPQGRATAPPTERPASSILLSHLEDDVDALMRVALELRHTPMGTLPAMTPGARGSERGSFVFSHSSTMLSDESATTAASFRPSGDVETSAAEIDELRAHRKLLKREVRTRPPPPSTRAAARRRPATDGDVLTRRCASSATPLHAPRARWSRCALSSTRRAASRRFEKPGLRRATRHSSG